MYKVWNESTKKMFKKYDIDTIKNYRRLESYMKMKEEIAVNQITKQLTEKFEFQFEAKKHLIILAQ